MRIFMPCLVLKAIANLTGDGGGERQQHTFPLSKSFSNLENDAILSYLVGLNLKVSF